MRWGRLHDALDGMNRAVQRSTVGAQDARTLTGRVARSSDPETDLRSHRSTADRYQTSNHQSGDQIMSAQLISATTPDPNIQSWSETHIGPSAHPRTASGAYARIMSDELLPASLRLAYADTLKAWARGAADVLMERDSTPETMARAARVSCMVADAKNGADPECDDDNSCPGCGAAEDETSGCDTSTTCYRNREDVKAETDRAYLAERKQRADANHARRVERIRQDAERERAQAMHAFSEMLGFNAPRLDEL